MAQQTTFLRIQEVAFNKAIEDRYLAYALSTIMSRSLPDVRDGMKPVHRRLIYAMQQLRLNPNSPFKKCARIVGDVMGKFHPHGDAAIYGALVRLAQDFSVRYPLIEGQGNFGNIDGDGAAAMRYTEARLSDVAVAMMEGIEEECVDFRSTYDGETEEPVIFPTLFPNLLANGATGIAVGMATSIPPHNVDELCQALDHLIAHPNATTQDLCAFVKGPDFPTGCLLMESEASILQAYETGKGSFRLRAHWFVEPGKNGTYKIVVDQIPYMVEKAKMVEKIASLILERKNSFLDDVQDESTDEIRLVLYPKSRNVAPEVLMESLFQQTDLDVRFPLNMNVLDLQGVPRVLSLQEVLASFLQHASTIQLRQAQHNLRLVADRLNILNGLLVVYLNLDRVIAIIRESDDPKAELMSTFGLNDIQAESILNMRLRSLRKLQEIEIRKEVDELTQRQATLEALIGDEKKQRQQLRKSFQAIRKRFGNDSVFGPRRTVIAGAAKALAMPIEVVEDEPLTIFCSEKNWIKAVKGRQEPGSGRYKEGDQERFVLPCRSRDKILVMASNGRVYSLDAHKIPQTKGNGESLRLMIEIPDEAQVVAMRVLAEADLAKAREANAKTEEAPKGDEPQAGSEAPAPQSDAEEEIPSSEETDCSGPLFLVASSAGYGFLVRGANLLAQTKNGRQILSLRDEEKVLFFEPVEERTLVALIGTNRKMIVFRVEEIPVLTKGRGVRLQRYSGAKLSDLQLFGEEGFVWRRGDQRRTTANWKDWLVRRGALGRLPPPLFPRDNKFHQN